MPIYEGEADLQGDMLEQAEIEALLLGRTITGQDYASGIQWWHRQNSDGTVRRWDNDENESRGTLTIEDGWACWEWDAADDPKRCSRIYRNPKGTPERLDRFLLVGTGCGSSIGKFSMGTTMVGNFLCPFRIEEQAVE